MDFGKAGAGQAAPQSRVETLGSGDEEISARHAAMPHEVDILVEFRATWSRRSARRPSIFAI